MNLLEVKILIAHLKSEQTAQGIDHSEVISFYEDEAGKLLDKVMNKVASIILEELKGKE